MHARLARGIACNIPASLQHRLRDHPCWRHRPCTRPRRTTRFGAGLCLRSSSPPSTSTTTYASSYSASIGASPASIGRSCSSTMIPPTAPSRCCAICPAPMPVSAICSASAGADWRRRSSRECCSPARPMSPSWTPTCSTTRASSPRCCGGSGARLRYRGRLALPGQAATGDWSKARRLISDVATRLTRLVLRTKVSDPMSGFFMLKRDAFDAAVRRLSSTGYKILLDILVSAPRPLAVVEVPYVFRAASTARASSISSDAGIPHAAARQDGRAVRAGPLRDVRAGRRRRRIRAHAGARRPQSGAGAGIHGEPARRHRCRHDVQLLRQQCSDLSGQAPERSLAGHARAADVLCRVRHRRAFQRRHRHGAVPRGLFLVACRPCRNSGRRRVELCREFDGHVAEAS